MEATRYSETSVDFQRTTRCYIPEDRTFHNHSCKNLSSNIVLMVLEKLRVTSEHLVPKQKCYLLDRYVEL
jgi:hypothetical protein